MEHNAPILNILEKYVSTLESPHFISWYKAVFNIMYNRKNKTTAISFPSWQRFYNYGTLNLISPWFVITYTKSFSLKYKEKYLIEGRRSLNFDAVGSFPNFKDQYQRPVLLLKS